MYQCLNGAIPSQGNVPLRHLLYKETLFMSWQRSAIKEVNDWALYVFTVISDVTDIGCTRYLGFRICYGEMGLRQIEQDFSSLFLPKIWYVWWYFKVEGSSKLRKIIQYARNLAMKMHNSLVQLDFSQIFGWFRVLPETPISRTQSITNMWLQ